MANKYIYSYLKPPKKKTGLENTEKVQHYPHVNGHSRDSYVANLSLLSLLFVVLGSIGQWFANRSVFRYPDIKFKYLFLKSKKPNKQSKLFMLSKAVLFFLIIISNDVKSPNNNQHDREFQQHCELSTNRYLKIAERMITNRL